MCCQAIGAHAYGSMYEVALQQRAFTDVTHQKLGLAFLRATLQIFLGGNLPRLKQSSRLT